MATTAERIKEALLIRGMKQSELAEKTKIGKSSISTYITGSYEPKQKNLHKLAAALNVSEAWLMGYDVPMESKYTVEKYWELEGDREATKRFMKQYKEDLFLQLLNHLGWTCERQDTGSAQTESNYKSYYVFKKEENSFRVSREDYNAFIDDLEFFTISRLEKLYEKSKTILFPKKEKKYLEPQAAHERTDIEVTDDMRKHDDDIMDDDEFWNK